MFVPLRWACFGVVFLSLIVGHDGRAASSVKSGVFSEAQAKRGQDVIQEECARCHSANLLGSGENNTPPLVGEVFLEKWYTKPLGELFDKMRMTMPVDDPGRLSKTQYATALAYILQMNKYPPGPKPLPTDMNALNDITIER